MDLMQDQLRLAPFLEFLLAHCWLIAYADAASNSRPKEKKRKIAEAVRVCLH